MQNQKELCTSGSNKLGKQGWPPLKHKFWIPNKKKRLKFEHSDTKSDKEREYPIMAEPQEILLGDYGGVNTPLGHLTIMNQPVNDPNFQLNPTIICQLENRSFTGKINEDANKHLQRFLTMSTTLKIEGHTKEAKN